MQKFVLLLILVYWVIIDDISKIGQEIQARSDLICIFKLGGNYQSLRSIVSKTIHFIDKVCVRGE